MSFDRGWISCLLAFGVGLAAYSASPGTLLAAETGTADQVEELYLDGVAMYRAGKYGWAIRKFEQAYEVYPDPKLLYNIARSHEARAELDLAREHYRRCVEDQRTEARVREKASQRLTKLERIKARSEAAAPIEPSRTENKARGEGLSANRDRFTTSAHPQRSDGAAGLALTKWITGAIGLGLVAGGAVALGLGAADQQQVDDASDKANASSGKAELTRVEAIELQDDANSKKVIGYVLGGIGAATLVTAAALFLLDGYGPDESGRGSAVHEVGFVPLPSGGAVALGGVF